MSDRALDLAGVRVLQYSTDGAPPRNAKDATDIVSAAWSHQAKIVVLSAQDLESRLSSA